LIYFRGALEHFNLAWRLLLDDTWLRNCYLECNCGRELRTAAAFGYQFELLIHAGSQQIVYIIVSRCHCVLMMRVLQTKRYITSGCHGFEAPDSGASVADRG
jgi:hypothetical protein